MWKIEKAMWTIVNFVSIFLNILFWVHWIKKEKPRWTLIWTYFWTLFGQYLMMVPPAGELCTIYGPTKWTIHGATNIGQFIQSLVGLMCSCPNIVVPCPLFHWNYLDSIYIANETCHIWFNIGLLFSFSIFLKSFFPIFQFCFCSGVTYRSQESQQWKSWYI